MLTLIADVPHRESASVPSGLSSPVLIASAIGVGLAGLGALFLEQSEVKWTVAISITALAVALVTVVSRPTPPLVLRYGPPLLAAIITGLMAMSNVPAGLWIMLYTFAVTAAALTSRLSSVLTVIVITVGAAVSVAMAHTLASAVWLWLVLVLTIVLLALVLRYLVCAAVVLQQKLSDADTTDPLTGLANRAKFTTELAEQLARCDQSGHTAAVVLIDVDRLAKVNGEHGAAAGDSVLIRISDLLRNRVRHSDVVARVGGGEFALCMPDTDLGDAVTFAEDLRWTVEKDPHAVVDVTVSIGVTDTTGSFNADQLMFYAAEALQAAKDEGRNQIIVSGSAVPKHAVPGSV